jgi:glucans biosynthesis protein
MLPTFAAFAAPGGKPAMLPKTIFGTAHAFDFNWLRQRAKNLAQSPYAPPPSADILQSIDFDLSQKIQFRKEFSVWSDTPGHLPLRLFHLNKYVPQPVSINIIEGRFARPIVYSPAYFDYGNTGLDKKLPPRLGFAGFRVMDSGSETDWLAFLGASYFRSSGAENQYGLSARGIAVNTALATAEEFPRFTDFWIAEPTTGGVTIYALLQGPSLTGAYKFQTQHNRNVVMDVHAELFVRNDITRFGMAPLTSMYWYGENERAQAVDWRPEVHDSDGLAMWTGKGERIWRPLVDPPSLQTNSFMDANPKGFGLMQRDRNFDSYQDDGAFYNRRPSLWIEPRGAWGEGAVQLVEIPTDDEVHDNIVVYWQPKDAVKSGDTRTFDYRLYWQDDEPFMPNVARVIATRVGRAGVPGRPPPPNKTKFVIDFEGGALSQMAARFDVTPVVSDSRGMVDNAYVIKVVGTSRWRALFDVDTDGKDPLDLRCYLRLGDQTLSETWLYQYFPNT